MLIKMITYINMIYLKSIIMGNDMEHIKSKKDSTGGIRATAVSILKEVNSIQKEAEIK